MRTAAILLPACYPDAIGQGEYHREGELVHIGCPSCGVVQRVEQPDLLWSCVNPSCVLMLWLEFAGAN